MKPPAASSSGAFLIWTRSLEDWPRDVELMAGLSLPVLHLPCLRLEALQVTKPLPNLGESNRKTIVVFTSAHAVAFAMQHPEYGPFLLALKNTLRTRFLAVGRGTFTALDNYGLPAYLPRDVFDGRSLASYLLREYASEPEINFVLPGPEERAFDLEGTLSAVGFHCSRYDLYRSQSGLFVGSAPLSGLQKSEYLRSLRGVVCFASPSAARGFCTDVEASILDTNFRAIVIGPTTREACRKFFSVISVANTTSLSELIKEARKHPL